MIAINTLTSIAAPLDISNIDTDQIIPKQFLKRIERTGYGEFLFFDWARIQEGPDTGKPDARLHPQQPRLRRRENPHRRQKLRLRQLPRARRLGPHRLRLPRRHRPQLRRHLLLQRRQERHGPRPPPRSRRRTPHSPQHQEPAPQDHHQPRSPDRHRRLKASAPHFDIDPFRKYCLLNGLDDIGLTLRHESELDAYESKHDAEFWLAPRANTTSSTLP